MLDCIGNNISIGDYIAYPVDHLREFKVGRVTALVGTHNVQTTLNDAPWLFTARYSRVVREEDYVGALLSDSPSDGILRDVMAEEVKIGHMLVVYYGTTRYGSPWVYAKVTSIEDCVDFRNFAKGHRYRVILSNGVKTGITMYAGRRQNGNVLIAGMNYDF